MPKGPCNAITRLETRGDAPAQTITWARMRRDLQGYPCLPHPCDAAVQRASTPNGKDECAAKGTLGRPRQQPRMPGKDDGLTSYGLGRLNRVSGPNFLVAPPLIARWAIASVVVAFHVVCGRAPPLAIQNLRRRFRDIAGGWDSSIPESPFTVLVLLHDPRTSGGDACGL